MEMNFASKGVAGAGLGLGIAGTALGVLNGGLKNLLGGAGWNGGADCSRHADASMQTLAIASALSNLANGGRSCPEDHPVSRYDAAQAARIAELETEVKLRDANTYTDGKILDLYRYVDGKFACVEGQLAQQAVYNATNTTTLNFISGQVAQLMSLTKCVIPTTSICPEPMLRYNSWTAPAADAAATA